MDPSEHPPGYRQLAGVELHGAGAAAQDEAAVGLPGVLGEERQEMAGVGGRGGLGPLHLDWGITAPLLDDEVDLGAPAGSPGFPVWRAPNRIRT